MLFTPAFQFGNMYDKVVNNAASNPQSMVEFIFSPIIVQASGCQPWIVIYVAASNGMARMLLHSQGYQGFKLDWWSDLERGRTPRPLAYSFLLFHIRGLGDVPQKRCRGGALLPEAPRRRIEARFGDNRAPSLRASVYLRRQRQARRIYAVTTTTITKATSNRIGHWWLCECAIFLRCKRFWKASLTTLL